MMKKGLFVILAISGLQANAALLGANSKLVECYSQATNLKYKISPAYGEFVITDAKTGTELVNDDGYGSRVMMLESFIGATEVRMAHHETKNVTEIILTQNSRETTGWVKLTAHQDPRAPKANTRFKSDDANLKCKVLK